MKKCATCWKDPATKNWHNPDKVKFGGTSESNWVCDRCKKRKVNRPWVATPRAEVYGIECEEADDAHAEPDRVPGPYETPLCIEIMKRYVLGESQRAIAAGLKTDRRFVRRTIYFWKTNYGYFLTNLIEKLAALH